MTRTQYDGRRDEGREEGRFALMRSKNVGVLRVGTKIYSRRCCVHAGDVDELDRPSPFMELKC